MPGVLVPCTDDDWRHHSWFISAIPVRYEFSGEPRLFATTADLIAPRFRGRLSYVRRLSELLHKGLAAAGISVAPLRVRHLPLLASALRIGIRAWNLITPSHKCERRLQWPIQKINDDAFRRYRYCMFPIKYHEVKLPDGGLCVYTTEPFVDVDPPTRESLEYAVNAVRRRNPQTEFVAYQGFLPWTVCPAQAG